MFSIFLEIYRNFVLTSFKNWCPRIKNHSSTNEQIYLGMYSSGTHVNHTNKMALIIHTRCLQYILISAHKIETNFHSENKQSTMPGKPTHLRITFANAANACSICTINCFICSVYSVRNICRLPNITWFVHVLRRWIPSTRIGNLNWE